jgi:Zn-dependent M32 family carboxypeptidase
LAHPFSSDQPSNAIQLEKAGVALINNRKTCTAESISRKIKTILKDRQQEFITKANELRTFAHIAKRRKELAADILEQQVLCSREGKAWYYEQEDDYWHLFMPSWRKIVISLISLKVAPYFFGALRKYMSKMVYQRITQGPKVVYSKSKKL